MRGTAFCPAHITGFFKIQTANSDAHTGSLGAGFSISKGVTTTVQEAGTDIMQDGMTPYVLEEFRRVSGNRTPVHIRHNMEIPAGYGLGASGALALSTLYALDAALETEMVRTRLGMMAHEAELHHRSGLGDVVAAYHGGFEIRMKAGGPGEGVVRMVDVGEPAVIIACLSPLSTSAFLQNRMHHVNGLGDRMIEEFDTNTDLDTFQRLSVAFAKKLGILTPKMLGIIRSLEQAGYPCGVAMLGETVFSMVDGDDADHVLEMLRQYNPMLTTIDPVGARTV